MKRLNLSEKEIDELIESKPSIFNYAILSDLKDTHRIMKHLVDMLKTKGKTVKIEWLKEEEKIRETDMTGKICEICGKGKYIETGFQDDMNGVLHCSECGYRVKRWKRIN